MCDLPIEKAAGYAGTILPRVSFDVKLSIWADQEPTGNLLIYLVQGQDRQKHTKSIQSHCHVGSYAFIATVS